MTALYLIWNSAKAIVIADITIELTASTIACQIMRSIGNKLEDKTS